MNVSILVVEYEPRYVEHVRTALAASGYRLEIVSTLDEAVNRCATLEPTLVIMTSVLPNLKIEDAITQLRARAGLRATPILILMSGYRGDNPKEDAVRYGAQDILERPFGADALSERVEELILNAPSSAATQAIPQEMLEALRRSAGLDGGQASVTSDDLFGDILSDIEGGEQQPVKKPADVPPPTPIPDPSRVDAALADIMESGKHQPKARATHTSETDVDKLLEETLSGLHIKPSAVPPQPAPPEKPAVSESPSSPKSSSQAVAPPPRGEESAAAEGSRKPPRPDREPPSRDPAPTAKGPAPSTGDTFGQYMIEEHIATGGMADVYKARMIGMEGFQKTVAIKRIISSLTDSDEFVRMFIDEAKLAAQLSHNNIIQIFDLGKVDRSHYIAMEFIEGRDLRSILEECNERDAIMPISLALYITTLLASALDYAHRKRDFENRDLGLVHRDVSPQNVLISFAGDVKLCDFGIAKAATKASQTRAGALKGKLQYMSPEQAWGKDIDHRSDIFSLGLVLYEMLTSEKVFAGDSELSVLEQVRDPIIPAPSTKNPDVDAEIDRIVFLALNADREERYQSAQDFQRDLEKVLRHHDWSPDRESVAGLLVQLGDDGGSGTTPVAPPVDTAVVPPPQEPPPPPPPEIPIAPPPMEDERGGLFVVDEELERALGSGSEPDTAVAVLDIEDGGTAWSSDAAGGGNKRLWILLGVLMAAVVVVVGGWLIYRGMGSKVPPASRSIAVVPTATRTPEPTIGLLSEEELIEQAREVAAAEILKQEEGLRKRLEEEFPTPTSTPVPPTPTPTETETPEPTLTPTLPPTATPIPPTATPIPPTPTPSVREGDIVTLGPGVIVPTVIYQEQPQYPAKARSMQVDGLVDAEALVGINGVVEDVRIVNVSRKKVGFEEATETAIMKWRYKPATKKGVKVRMWVPIRVPFRLR
jgi:TonB family protein